MEREIGRRPFGRFPLFSTPQLRWFAPTSRGVSVFDIPYYNGFSINETSQIQSTNRVDELMVEEVKSIDCKLHLLPTYDSYGIDQLNRKLWASKRLIDFVLKR